MTSHGKRVALVVDGFRGDCQPYIALALSFQRVGLQVKCLTNENHVGFFTRFGLDCVSVFHDTEKQAKEDEELQMSMKEGSVFRYLNNFGEVQKKHFPTELEKSFRALEDFHPDVICTGFVSMTIAAFYAHIHMIPSIPVCLQENVYTGEHGPFGVVTLPFAWMNKAVWRLLYAIFVKQGQESLKVAERVLGRTDFKMAALQSVSDAFFTFSHSAVPAIMGFSELVVSMPKDTEGRERYKLSGFWVLDERQQVERFLAGDLAFGGSQVNEIQQFLAGGQAPIYLGWGSMIAVSPEHMANLAVGALWRLQRRGIILQGWSGLGPKMLESEALQAYAARHVLFVESAPHEWLLRQCALSVHHGGCGTTAAALRAGKPTVITPCFLDQFDFARAVNTLGVGVGMRQFRQVTTEMLAETINSCLADSGMQARAAELGEKLRAEDGPRRAAEELVSFIEEELDTGKWRSNVEGLNRARRQAIRSSSPCYVCMSARDPD